MKDLYIENVLNAQRWVSRIRFRCPVCNELVDQEVDVPELNFAAENSSDMFTDGEIEITCEACDGYFKGDPWVGPAHCDVVLRDYQETTVSCEPPGYDRPPEYWFEVWEIPNSPKDVFDRNHEELSKIINT